VGESELFRRSVESDAAFEEIYRRHAPRLFRWLTRETSREQALDLVAETFAQMLLSVERYRGESDAAAVAWLNGIARNLLCGYIRGRGKEGCALRKLEIEEAVAVALSNAAVDLVREVDELAEAVDQAFAELSVEARRAVRMRVVEELPYAEVARRLEIDPATARTRVSRALRAMGTKLRGELG
jgi:RNA polymerase sigma factor (sigma-70 family)